MRCCQHTLKHPSIADKTHTNAIVNQPRFFLLTVMPFTIRTDKLSELVRVSIKAIVLLALGRIFLFVCRLFLCVCLFCRLLVLLLLPKSLATNGHPSIIIITIVFYFLVLCMCLYVVVKTEFALVFSIKRHATVFVLLTTIYCIH